MTGKNEDHIVLQRFQPLHLVLNTPKGRGVYAPIAIPSGTIIDISPVLVLDPVENAAHIEKTSLYHYTYNWPIPSSLHGAHPIKSQAVVLGLGSLFNHSTQHQNVGWTRDLAAHVIVYRTLRDVRAGEELCISYGDHLTFVDVDAERGRAEDTGEEGGEDMLSKIAVDDDDDGDET